MGQLSSLSMAGKNLPDRDGIDVKSTSMVELTSTGPVNDETDCEQLGETPSNFENRS